MSALKKRLNWADMMKGLAMFLVVFSHFPHPQWTNIFYSPFTLAVFFFVSGYFFSPKGSFGEFVVNKFWKLVVPLFLFGSLGILESVLIGGESFSYRVSGIVLQIADKADTMWFFSCLFTLEIIFYWVYKAANKVAPGRLWAVCALSAPVLVIGFILCSRGQAALAYSDGLCGGAFLSRRISMQEFPAGREGERKALRGVLAAVYSFHLPAAQPC